MQKPAPGTGCYKWGRKRGPAHSSKKTGRSLEQMQPIVQCHVQVGGCPGEGGGWAEGQERD